MFRSKLSGIPDFTSDHPSFSQGNRQVQNLKNYPNLASDSSSCSSGITDDESFTFELGLRSSKQYIGSGTPMKNLLAKEMFKEDESRRRSPNVVAKLMGLDGLPSQPHYRHEKGASESYHRTPKSAEKCQRSNRRHDHRSSRKSLKDEQEFKDVFEVLEPPRVGSFGHPSRAASNSTLTDAEMAFIRQKFMDAKRLSTDEKSQDSKEFHEALEVLDSNKGLLLKFLQQPDPLFTKHLHDLQHAAPQPLCGRAAAANPSEVRMCENIHLRSKSAREALHKNRIDASPQKHRDRRPCHHHDCYKARNFFKLSKSEVDSKSESACQPTRIVVLKPNLGKVLKAASMVPSLSSSHASPSERRKDREIPLVKKREVELSGRRKFHRDEGVSGHKSRESRELAKEITMQMRNSFSNGSVRLSSTTFQGYAGDESSCSMSGNESTNELEVKSTCSKYSFNLSNHSQALSSRSTESSVSREAKKRLSERWKLNHRSQDMGSTSRGSTLADMLAISDKEKRPVHLNGTTESEGSRNKLSREDRQGGWVEPLGISSRDGWKDECIASLTRSKSLPSSSTVLGSPKGIMRREPIREDRYVMPKEAFKRERNKGHKNNLDKRSVNRHSRSNTVGSYPSHYTIRERNDSSPEIYTRQSQEEIELEVDSLPEQKLEDIKSLSDKDRSPFSKTPIDLERATTIPPEPLDNLLPESSSCTLVADVCNEGPQDDLSLLQEPHSERCEESPLPLNHPDAGLESSLSSKEADQPSPVSVLEAPFTDDLSSCSECFESLNADLQGLRRQLQLLKLESESYEEGPMILSSDEDVGEGSHGFSSQQSWESCYVAEALTHSRLDDTDPDVFLASWHTPECPISPSVFDELEKTNHDLTTQPKTERRLLFDRINYAILELYQKYTDSHPWVRSSTTLFGPRWCKHEFQDCLFQLLASQEKTAKKDTTEKVLSRESKWSEIQDDIDLIGRDIEKLMLDELVGELVAI